MGVESSAQFNHSECLRNPTYNGGGVEPRLGGPRLDGRMDPFIETRKVGHPMARHPHLDSLIHGHSRCVRTADDEEPRLVKRLVGDYTTQPFMDGHPHVFVVLGHGHPSHLTASGCGGLGLRGSDRSRLALRGNTEHSAPIYGSSTTGCWNLVSLHP